MGHFVEQKDGHPRGPVNNYGAYTQHIGMSILLSVVMNPRLLLSHESCSENGVQCIFLSPHWPRKVLANRERENFLSSKITSNKSGRVTSN